MGVKKSNKLSKVAMKETKIPDFDDFFKSSQDPLEMIVGWNNELQDFMSGLKKLGADIRKSSSKDAPKPIGKLSISMDTGKVKAEILDDDGKPVPPKAQGKVIKAYFSLVTKKAAALEKRIKAVQKKEGMEKAEYMVNKKSEVEFYPGEGAEEAQEKLADDKTMLNLTRSMGKFNERADALDQALKGGVSLGEAISAVVNSMKASFKEKGGELGVAIGDSGLPAISGIPDDVEEFFGKIVAQAWKLLQAMIDFVAKLLEQLPEIKPKLEELITQAKEMPGKAKSAATEAGLGGMDMLKAVRAVANNVKTLGGSPKMLTTLSDTVKATVTEVATSMSGKEAGDDKEPEDKPRLTKSQSIAMGRPEDADENEVESDDEEVPVEEETPAEE